jgi:hypothetical protein
VVFSLSIVKLTLILIQSIEFTFLCPENYLNLPENLLEITLKLLMSNYWGCCHQSYMD